MASYRKHSARAPGWMHAILFNALLLLLPILAARIIIAAFTVQGFGVTPTPESLTETRRNIDAAFVALAPRGADQRAFWADLFDTELRARDMSAARGVLLAAPVMLDSDDAKSIKAAAEADISGSEDHRVARAALLFLPDNVRARYERTIRPPTMPARQPDAVEDAVADDAETIDPELAPDDTARRQVAALGAPMDFTAQATGGGRFSVLGDYADLADRSRRWVDGERVDAFVLRITGFGMVARSTRPEPIDLELAASILKSARRAGRLQPGFVRYLDQRLSAVVPEDALAPRLAAVFEDLAPRTQQAEQVRAAFVETLNTDAMPRLEEELALITRISDLTSPNGAIAMLEHVNSPDDLRRARLIAEAGGDRGPALAKQMEGRVLSLAKSGARWTQDMVLQVMALAALAMALLWAAISGLARAFFQPRPMEITVI